MKLNAILLIFAVIIAGGLMWYSAHNGSGTVPIIRADTTPIKERPHERGGMNIAHKDSTIYNTMRGGDNGHVENLLAERPTESNINREELFAGIKAQQATQPQQQAPVSERRAKEATQEKAERKVPVITENTVTESTIINPPSETAENDTQQKTVNVSTPIARPQNAAPIAKTQSAGNTADKKELTSLLAEVQGLKIDPIQKKEKATPSHPTSAKTGDYYIQIGSLTSETAAKAHWAARKKEFAAALTGFSLRIEQVDIAGRGRFYRVQGGAVSKDTAKSACATINARHKNSCIVK